jgi:cbb3-type cytochrome oxidase subunit 3
MDELRSALTIISLLTFVGIVWWAWRPGSRDKARLAVSDMLTDDDRKPYSQSRASSLDPGAGK